VREMIERHLGRRLEDLAENPAPVGRTDHMGLHPQKQAGLYYLGYPVFPGILSGGLMIAAAEVVDSYSGEIRLTREQNLIITHVPEARVAEVDERMERIGFSRRVNAMRGTSIACTGEPYCNFAVGETKEKIVRVVERLESRFGDRASQLRIYLDGCPHACGQHWVGDLGFQGTTGRSAAGGKIQAYDIILRGGLGRDAEIGRPLLRRIPTEQVEDCVERLVAAYLSEDGGRGTLQEFCRRRSDEELIAIATGQVSMA